jgi:predicted ATP-grasp superfamily ATP-dependent carboligase
VVKSFGGARSTVDTLLAAGSRLQLDGWVLYPTREETVAAISQHRQELAQRFRVPTPEWEVIRWAWDKRNTYALAHQLGIPTPRTWYPKTVDDLLAIDGSPPFAVKPAIKEHFFYATRAKAWKASTRAELAGLFQRAAGIVGPGEVMIQEFIPGGGDQQLAYCAFFKSGVAVGEMVARRLRQHPLEFGRASTLVETANLPLLESLSERLLRAIDYYGLVEIEYKLDPRDGQYKLLDINARTWGYHSLGGAAGVDFPYLLFLDQIGHHAEPCRARAGVRWVRTLTDLPTAIVAVLKRRLSWSAYVRSLRGLTTDAVFCRDDPVPGLLEVALLPYLALKRGF